MISSLVAAQVFTYAECVLTGITPWNLFPRQRTTLGAHLPGPGSRSDPKKQHGSPIPASNFIMQRNSRQPRESPFSSRFLMTVIRIWNGCPHSADYSRE